MTPIALGLVAIAMFVGIRALISAPKRKLRLLESEARAFWQRLSLSSRLEFLVRRGVLAARHPTVALSEAEVEALFNMHVLYSPELKRTADSVVDVMLHRESAIEAMIEAYPEVALQFPMLRTAYLVRRPLA